MDFLIKKKKIDLQHNIHFYFIQSMLHQKSTLAHFSDNKQIPCWKKSDYSKQFSYQADFFLFHKN